MISGYALNEQGPLAICCFEDMYFKKSIKPSKVTFMSILKACNIIGGIQQGRKIHEHIIESGLEPDLAVGTTLIDMYAKSGNFDEAHRVLEKLTYRDVVAFGAIIGGYAELKEGVLALELFYVMKSEGIKPDKIIYLSTLKACGSLGIIEHGRLIHEQIIQEGLQFDSIIESSLVDMYATCGNMEEAGIFFRLLPNRNVVAWAAMIAGYAQLGDSRSAVQYFQDMQCIGLKPDDIAFTSILTACNRTGLVDEGRLYLKLMSECHGIRPGAFHITCMVDLLGRAGCFREAEILSGIGIEYDSCLWMTLLSACKIHSNMELGERCFHKLIDLNSCSTAAYVLMLNLYCSINTENACQEAVKLNDSWEKNCFLTKPAI